MVGTLRFAHPTAAARRRFAGVEPTRFPKRCSFLHRPPQKKQRIAVIKADLSDLYRNYIACLNKQDWPMLGQFVHHDVVHNGRRVGLSGYLEMLERDFDEIPDLHFNIRMLIADPPYIASRLSFDCTPKGSFLGLQVGGKRVSFTENVFYEFRNDKIREVWSVIDKMAIEAQP
jgi:predicted ester cyclase